MFVRVSNLIISIKTQFFHKNTVNMGSKGCLKCVLHIVNVLLLLACAGLIYVGIWSLREYSNYSTLIPKVYMIGLPVGTIFFVASLLFVVAITGIVATCSEAKCLVAMYCTMLLVTCVLLVASVGLLYASEHIVVGGMEKDLDKGLQDYFLDPNVTKEIDYLQQSHKCCGVRNYTDWTDTPWYSNQTHFNGSFNFPESCCLHENCTFESHSSFVVENVFRKGCYPTLSRLLRSKLIIGGSVSAAVAVAMVIGFAMICALYNRRTDFEYIGVVDDDAVRV